MTITEQIHPDTAFSLAAAAGFEFGPMTGRPAQSGAGAHEMRMAFVTDDMRHHAGVHLAQAGGGSITATIDSMADLGAVALQVRRNPSLDHPAAEWPVAGERDPVLGQLQRERAWPRPVLFPSPYEAAAWSIISAGMGAGRVAWPREVAPAALDGRLDPGPPAAG